MDPRISDKIRRVSIKFNAVFGMAPEGYIGYVGELPGANTQGLTLDETRENLKEAVEMVLEANRQLAEEELIRIDPSKRYHDTAAS